MIATLNYWYNIIRGEGLFKNIYKLNKNLSLNYCFM